MKGLFISFEGLEGSGKTTQSKRLHKWLLSEGYKCVFTQEPGGTEIAKKIREILLDNKNKELTPAAELFLYLADRAQNVKQVIKPALKTNKVVITDRFTDSTIAYQGGGRHFPSKVLEDLNCLVISGIKPDITIFLDIVPKKGLARIKSKDRMESEDLEFYERVRKVYLKLAKEEPERIKIIKGDLTIGEIEQQVRKLVKGKFKK